jgi:hypothetical protein
VYFHVDESEQHFPGKSKELRGRWVGFSEHIGNKMTYTIITDDTGEEVCRSAIRSALDPTMKNLRVHIPNKPRLRHLAHQSVVQLTRNNVINVCPNYAISIRKTQPNSRIIILNEVIVPSKVDKLSLLLMMILMTLPIACLQKMPIMRMILILLTSPPTQQHLQQSFSNSSSRPVTPISPNSPIHLFISEIMGRMKILSGKNLKLLFKTEMAM